MVKFSWNNFKDKFDVEDETDDAAKYVTLHHSVIDDGSELSVKASVNSDWTTATVNIADNNSNHFYDQQGYMHISHPSPHPWQIDSGSTLTFTQCGEIRLSDVEMVNGKLQAVVNGHTVIVDFSLVSLVQARINRLVEIAMSGELDEYQWEEFMALKQLLKVQMEGLEAAKDMVDMLESRVLDI